MITWLQGATQAGTQASALPWSSTIISAGVVTAVVGLIGVVIGQYLTGRRHSEDLRLREQGQITERFTRAIDQLGATNDKGEKKLEVRLGGIYALERIARDSERDHWPIMETLTTYVREHAPWPPKKNSRETGFILPPQMAQNREVSNKPEDPTPETISVPEPDIQAILTVLRRRTRYFGNGEVERIDLHKTRLRQGNLLGVHLEGADLFRANLEGADLRQAKLGEADLQEANLEGANLWGADLWGADLKEANLAGATLWGATLGRANLQEANLEGANLEGAELPRANLEGAIFLRANLKGAMLERANLERANLFGANLVEAILTEANLERAILGEAKLWGAYYLTEEQIGRAVGDEATKLPAGLSRPASWV